MKAFLLPVGPGSVVCLRWVVAKQKGLSELLVSLDLAS